MQILHMENVTDKKFLLGSHLLVGLPPLLLVKLGLPFESMSLSKKICIIYIFERWLSFFAISCEDQTRFVQASII